MSFIRESKYRHVFGEASKLRYEDLRLSGKSTESTGIRVNSKFVSFAWDSGGGGTLAVLPISKTGRMPRDLPLIAGHTGGIQDFEFNPFDENMVLTGSEDTTLKLWQIPEDGLKAHLKDPLATLEGHGKKVTFCTFNPTAGSIMASTAFDLTLKVWNIAEQEEAFSIPMPEQVMHLKWNAVGSLMAATCKDKKLRLIDPRANKFTCSAKVHEGSKACKVEWSGPDDPYKIFTTGFTQQAERQIGVWDIRKMGDSEDIPESLNTLQLDNGTGALFPFYDAGTQMLFVAGKGDANVRYFEATSTDPYLHFINDYRTTVPQKGFEVDVKRNCDVSKHEVLKCFKLESGAITPISFRVPRKSDQFQEDIFPDCPAGVPSMPADEWVGGAESRPPVLKSMDPAKAGSGPAKPAASVGAVVSVKDLKKQLAEKDARIEALEKEVALLKAKLDAVGG